MLLTSLGLESFFAFLYLLLQNCEKPFLASLSEWCTQQELVFLLTGRSLLETIYFLAHHILAILGVERLQAARHGKDYQKRQTPAYYLAAALVSVSLNQIPTRFFFQFLVSSALWDQAIKGWF